MWNDSSANGYVYNKQVFAKDGLQQGPHTVVASAVADQVNLVLFDYAIYRCVCYPTSAAIGTNTNAFAAQIQVPTLAAFLRAQQAVKLQAHLQQLPHLLEALLAQEIPQRRSLIPHRRQTRHTAHDHCWAPSSVAFWEPSAR